MRAALPARMRAAALDRFGGPEVLALREQPLPALGPGEVLIAVDTAGVGSWDADIREGWSPGGRPRLPLVLGSDGAGHVAALGARVRRFAVGERVFAYDFDLAFGKGGFYAEYVAVPAQHVAHVPRGVDLEHAGAVPVAGLTALQGIEDVLRLRRGERIAIHGAAGGVGSLAVQLAKRRGALVLATASRADGLAFVRRLGADLAVDGHTGDVAAAARAFAPAGLDAVLALASGPALARLAGALRRGGRLAYPNGVEPRPRKRRGVRVLAFDAEPGAPALRRLARAIDTRKLEIPIAAAYPLARAADAHRRLAAGHVLGKVVLRITEV